MIDPAILNFCRDIESSRGRAFLVGGWVRDFISGIPSNDYDLEVYGIESEALLGLLHRHGDVNVVGEAFTVYKVRMGDVSADVSLPRRESRTGRGHRGFTISGDPQMTFGEATRRRDFTVNAILYDPLCDEIIDPFDGRRDIDAKVLRAVDPATFSEDSLRVLRAMQLASRLEYVLDDRTVELCNAIDLSDLPSERIWAEVEKWLLLSTKPSIGFHLAARLGITRKLWPELDALGGCPQDPEWHPEGDVDVHTAMVLDQAKLLIEDLDKPRKLAVMLGALCHDFGKPGTTKLEDGRIRSKGHEEAGIAPTESFLNRLNVNSVGGYDVRRQVKAIVANHLVPNHFYKATLKGDRVTDGAFRRLAARVETDLLYRVARADCLGRTGDFKPIAEEWFLENVKALGVMQKPPERILLGRHLLEIGMQPGPEIGRLTNSVYEMQLDGRVTNLDEALEAARSLIATA